MGEVFAGRYELVDLIGQGGMGTVWRVWDARTGTIVAAKVLRQSDAATLLRFVREQSVRIHHPHVVVPIGWAGEDDRVLFTMPVVRGGSVATLVQDFGALPPLLVAELLRQLLDALGAVHAAGIVHRDVKPANLLLDPTGSGRPHLYLTDFGISVDLNSPRWTETGVVSGTPGYLAPELERSGTVTPAVDLYAAGQVAMTMLLGARPSERAGGGGPPADVPERLWDVVRALASPDPADRPQDAAEALTRLAAPGLAWVPEAIGDVEVFEHVPANALVPAPAAGDPDDGTTRPRPDAPAPTTSEPQRTSRTSALVVAGLGLLAVVGVVLIWSPWTGGGSSGVPNSATSGTASSTTAETPTTTSTPSPTTSTTPDPTASTSPGTVSVGTVVSRVGQSCEFSEVGTREATVDGVAVVCTRRPDGSYAWLAP